MTKSVALTGGSGFVGRCVVRSLLDADLHVRALARNPDRFGLTDERLEIVKGDLSDNDTLTSLVAGATCVIHMAGAIAAPDRQTFETVNVTGTANVAVAAASAGVGRFIHLSSMAARDPHLSDYGHSKRAGETALADAAGNMPWIVLRPPAVYGPGDKATLPLIEQLLRRHAILPGAVRNRTSLIHVEDLSNALLMLTTSGGRPGGVHEIDDGTAGGYTWHDLAAIAAAVEGTTVRVHHIPRPVLMAIAHVAGLFARLTGRPAMVTPGKVRELYHADWVARHDLLQDASDWRPAIDFATGFAGTVDWYRREGWLPQRRGKARTAGGADQRETLL